MDDVIKKTADHVKSIMHKESTGHDWFHVERVWKNSVKIAEEEGADLFVVQLAALLHDLDDWKFNEDSNKAVQWLKSLELDEEVVEQVDYICKNISFKGGTNKEKMKTKEGQIVQDADRLDALGAIGIARCFAYGGFKQREIYNPDVKPVSTEVFNSLEHYKKHDGTSINHFHEKLLLLKGLMNTRAGKRMAEERHKFMELFLDKFMEEWDGD